MDWTLWPGFVVASLIVGLLPGPGVTSIVGYALMAGMRTGAGIGVRRDSRQRHCHDALAGRRWCPALPVADRFRPAQVDRGGVFSGDRLLCDP